MKDRLKFFMNRIRERLWIRPLVMCVVSIIAVFVARWADSFDVDRLVPDIRQTSIETLLNIMSSSMLVIATFAVASMVAAYASASSTATPRSFSLVISDDVSQNALSTFIGAFIFSVIALIALQNGYYESAGRFTLFVLTLLVFALVIITFVRWVDRIARLGRLGATVDKVEKAAVDALLQRRMTPTLGGAICASDEANGLAVHSSQIGYVQRIDIGTLQTYAEDASVRIRVAALPGTFACPDRVLAYVMPEPGSNTDLDNSVIESAFRIGHDRTFDEDPRFGIVVLAEIAGRSLSSAINDPGTAIDIIGTYVRLFALWVDPVDQDQQPPCEYDRVEVPELTLQDMFEDAFTVIARDGAGAIEVAVRLQKAFASLAALGDETLRQVALDHSRMALARAEFSMQLPHDIELVRKSASFIN